MIGHQRSIEKDAEPLPCNEEEEVEENMEDVFREYQRVQTGALVYRILVVSFQLIKSNDLQRRRYKYQNRITKIKPTWKMAKKMRKASMMRATM